MVTTWRDSYFVFCKSISRYWIFLFILVCIFEGISSDLFKDSIMPSFSNSKLGYYFEVYFMSLAFIGKIYVKSLFFNKIHHINNNIDHSIKELIGFTNRKFFIIAACCTCASIILNIIQKDINLICIFFFVLFVNYITTNNFFLHLIQVIVNGFIYIPVLLIIPSLLFTNNRLLSLLKGNWIKSFLIIALPLVINEIVFFNNYESRRIIRMSISIFLVPVIYIHFNNLKQNKICKKN